MLRAERAFLLGLSLRFSNMQCLHGRKFLGVHVQWDELAMPGLRRSEAVCRMRSRKNAFSETKD